MQAPVKITRLTVGSAVDHPFLLPSSFVLALEQSNQLQLLLPDKNLAKAKDTLALFWKRWAALYGSDHTVFEGLSQDDLRLTVPCRLHGDEGRSTSGNQFVPKPVFTFSFHFHDFIAFWTNSRQKEKPHHAHLVAMHAWRRNIEDTRFR